MWTKEKLNCLNFLPWMLAQTRGFQILFKKSLFVIFQKNIIKENPKLLVIFQENISKENLKILFLVEFFIFFSVSKSQLLYFFLNLVSVFSSVALLSELKLSLKIFQHDAFLVRPKWSKWITIKSLRVANGSRIILRVQESKSTTFLCLQQ